MRPWSCAAPGGAPCTHTEGKIRAGGSAHEQPGTAKRCSTATAWQILTSFQLLGVPVPSSTNPSVPSGHQTWPCLAPGSCWVLPEVLPPSKGAGAERARGPAGRTEGVWS